nr:hypothetical protein [Tanacetum cinerariifolium]
MCSGDRVVSRTCEKQVCNALREGSRSHCFVAAILEVKKISYLKPQDSVVIEYITYGYENNTIMDHMKALADIFNGMGDYKDVVAFLSSHAKRRTCKSVIAKLVFSASVYYIWQERNARIFSNQKWSSCQLKEVIHSAVRIKLLSCSFKKTRSGLVFARIWKLPESIFSTLGWLLEKMHVTWAHLKNKRRRLQLYTKSDEENAYSAWRRRHIQIKYFSEALRKSDQVYQNLMKNSLTLNHELDELIESLKSLPKETNEEGLANKFREQQDLGYGFREMEKGFLNSPRGIMDDGKKKPEATLKDLVKRVKNIDGKVIGKTLMVKRGEPKPDGLGVKIADANSKRPALHNPKDQPLKSILKGHTSVSTISEVFDEPCLVDKQGDTLHVNLSMLVNDVVIPGADIALPSDAVDEKANKFANTLYGYFIGRRHAFPIVDSYGRCFYTRVLIEVCAKHALVESFVVAILIKGGEGHSLETITVKYEWRPPQCETCKIFDHLDSKCPRKPKVVRPVLNRDDDFVKVNNSDNSRANKYIDDGINLLEFKNSFDKLREEDAVLDVVKKADSENTNKEEPRNVSTNVSSPHESTNGKEVVKEAVASSKYEAYMSSIGGGHPLEEDFDMYDDDYANQIRDLPRQIKAMERGFWQVIRRMRRMRVEVRKLMFRRQQVNDLAAKIKNIEGKVIGRKPIGGIQLDNVESSSAHVTTNLRMGKNKMPLRKKRRGPEEPGT